MMKMKNVLVIIKFPYRPQAPTLPTHYYIATQACRFQVMASLKA